MSQSPLHNKSSFKTSNHDDPRRNTLPSQFLSPPESRSTDFIPKRVLLTGGCGFIGSNVLSYLVENYKETQFVNLDKLDYCGNLKNVQGISGVVSGGKTGSESSTSGASDSISNGKPGSDSKPTHPNHIFVHGDITDKQLVFNLFHKYNFDCVFHFAALSHVDRSFTSSDEFVKTNVNGTHTLLEAAIRSTELVKFIHVSTDEVYGDLSFDEDRVVHEGDLMLPTNPYSASKAAAECLVRGFSFSFRLPSIVVRPNNVFGYAQWPEKLIPKAILLFRQNKQFPVHGDGKNTRSFLFVEDVCMAFDILMRRGEVFETYNISQPEERSNIEVLTSILECMGKISDPNVNGNQQSTLNSGDIDMSLKNDKLNPVVVSAIETSAVPSTSASSNTSTMSAEPVKESQIFNEISPDNNSNININYNNTTMDQQPDHPSLSLPPHISKHFSYHPDRAFNDKSYNTSSEKLNSLGWEINNTWKLGIEKTVKWYLKHGICGEGDDDWFGNIQDALDAHYGVLSKGYGDQLNLLSGNSSVNSSKPGSKTLSLNSKDSDCNSDAEDVIRGLDGSLMREIGCMHPNFQSFATGKKF